MAEPAGSYTSIESHPHVCQSPSVCQTGSMVCKYDCLLLFKHQNYVDLSPGSCMYRLEISATDLKMSRDITDSKSSSIEHCVIMFVGYHLLLHLTTLTHLLSWYGNGSRPGYPNSIQNRPNMWTHTAGQWFQWYQSDTNSKASHIREELPSGNLT